jgi:3-hydroxyisobutyrate dehydrogenase
MITIDPRQARVRKNATAGTADTKASASSQPEATVALLGTGTMGHGMAVSALRAGIPLVVWNREPESMRDLSGLGAEVASSAADAAARAAIVVTMVTNADAVMSIADDQGMLDALAPGAIWVQMSTIGVAGLDRVAALVERRRPDVTLVDAPVSGSKEPAEHGQLTIFASGADHARERLAPLFDALGQRTVWVGPLGTGSRLKLVNNTWLAFTSEALATSVALAHSVGLDTRTLIDALDGGPLMSPWSAAKLPRVANGDYSPQFSLALALKDVHLALDAVDSDRFEALASLAREWERAVDHGLGGEDVTVVTRALMGTPASTD